MAPAAAGVSALVMRPSWLLSTQYGPPMPTNALTSLAPILRMLTRVVPVTPASVASSSAPFSNAKKPLTWTNSLMVSVTKPVARTKRLVKAIWIWSLGFGPVLTVRPLVPNVETKSTTGGMPAGGPRDSLISIVSCWTETVRPWMPTSATEPTALRAKKLMFWSAVATTAGVLPVAGVAIGFMSARPNSDTVSARPMAPSAAGVSPLSITPLWLLSVQYGPPTATKAWTSLAPAVIGVTGGCGGA